VNTINIKVKIVGFCGAALLALLVFISLICLTMPTVTLGSLPKPNTLYQIKQESLEQTVSPFGSLFQQGLAGGQVPAMQGSMHVPPTAPSIPTLPVQPGMAGGQGIASNAVVVLGVLPPKVAIVQVNGKTMTVKLGDETACGVVENVTEEGVAIGSQFYELKSGGR